MLDSMATAQDQDVLRNMILTFRVTELQMLLGFAGRNKNGKKQDLQTRALDLVRIRSTPMQTKIRELYKFSQESQAAIDDDDNMMGQNGQPLNPYAGMNYNMTAAAMMSMGGPYGQNQQAALQGRNPYSPAAGYHGAGMPGVPHPNLYSQPYQMPRQIPVHPDVKFIRLPFYDIHAELLKPATLIAQGSNRFQEAQFQFYLSPSQATDIAANRDTQIGTKLDYLYQIQLRFGPLSLDPNQEVSDEFPPNVNVTVNNKVVQLPNPIPTNKPGVEPKRPPRPINIASQCKLTPILPNTVNIKWATEYGKGWVVGIWLVIKCSSEDLLDRLRKRGTREANFTRDLIVKTLNDNDDEVGLTSLKVSVLCPLGKMRMRVPCRPLTCGHLQCFDASTFLLMNEKKPTWNCPVCDSKALYDSLVIDGYFQEMLESSDLPRDENEIILEKDGTWRPVPKEDDNKSTNDGGKNGSSADRESANANAASSASHENNDCIELSDDDEDIPFPPPLPLPGGPMLQQPPLPPPMPAPPLPPPLPREIECIDLD